MRNFTDEQGFSAWFEGAVCGPNVGIVAREAEFGGVVGVITISAIIMGFLQKRLFGILWNGGSSRQGADD